MLRSLSIACCLIGVGVLAGCGGSQRGQAAWTGGYVGVWGNAVTFVQLQRHGHHLHGTVIGTPFGLPLAVRLPDAPDSWRLRPGQRFTITGTISGSRVLLHSPNGLGAIGTLSPSVLLARSTQHVPAGDPPLPLMRMRRTTLADYRALVTGTHG